MRMVQRNFLYTKGIEGNPSQKLSDMLKYIEKTTDNNVTNQDIASIQQLVERVKRKKEVGISYMKSWEIEKMIRDEAYSEGVDGGKDKVNRLIVLLSEAGRKDDIVKAARDKDYQERLFKEFNL